MRMSKPPKVLYYVVFTCGHYDVTTVFSLTKRRCPTCVEYVHTGEPGSPARLTRYKPVEK